MYRRTTGRPGFAHIVLILIVVGVAIAGLAGWALTVSKAKTNPTPTTASSTSAQTAAPSKAPDSASTIDSPSKIATKDGKQYFYYGAPAGQNNASPKKLLITMHGTAGSAERDYEIWKPFIKDGAFALASLNWWDGSGDTTADYTTPEEINAEIHDFLTAQGYTTNDVVVFEGFSRGSANSYSVVALDRASSSPFIRVAISSSGGVESSYYQSTTSSVPALKQANIFSGVDWILACGGKDPNPTRDGCSAMEKAKQFVSGKGATVLGLLQDPNGSHGALTTSSLGLAKQAIDLVEAKY